jgi:hypothetical protein
MLVQQSVIPITLLVIIKSDDSITFGTDLFFIHSFRWLVLNLVHYLFQQVPVAFHVSRNRVEIAADCTELGVHVDGLRTC